MHYFDKKKVNHADNEKDFECIKNFYVKDAKTFEWKVSYCVLRKAIYSIILIKVVELWIFVNVKSVNLLTKIEGFRSKIFEMHISQNCTHELSTDFTQS